MAPSRRNDAIESKCEQQKQRRERGSKQRTSSSSSARAAVVAGCSLLAALTLVLAGSFDRRPCLAYLLTSLLSSSPSRRLSCCLPHRLTPMPLAHTTAPLDRSCDARAGAALRAPAGCLARRRTPFALGLESHNAAIQRLCHESSRRCGTSRLSCL